MINATAWGIVEGYHYLTNTSNISVIGASVESLQNTGEGIAAYLLFTSIILLVAAMVYVRTKDMIPTLFTMMFTTFIVDYYNLLNFESNIISSTTSYVWHGEMILNVLYIFTVVALALTMYYKWKNR